MNSENNSEERYEGSYELPSSFNKRRYSELIDLLNDYFDDNWCFGPDDHYNEKNVIKLTILFPEVNLTDGRRHHLIKDLYVCLYVKSNCLLHTSSICGFRGKASQEEVDSRYSHSHLSGNVGDQTWFCTGSGPINSSLANCADEYDIERYDALFANICAFVEWESLSGGPYRKIQNIRSLSGNRELYVNYSLTDIIIKKLKLDDFDISIRKDIKVNINESFINACVKAGCPLGYQTTNGHWYETFDHNNDTYTIETNRYFKGKLVKTEVKRNYKINVDKKPYIKQIEHVASTIETRIRKKIFSSIITKDEVSEFREEVQVNDITRTVIPDKTLMQENFAY